MKSLDLSKPVQTRDGRKARIIATDLAGNQPLAVAVTDPSGNEWLSCFSLDGSYYPYNSDHPEPEDLVNTPERKEMFMNLYLEQDTKLAPTVVIGHETLHLAETKRSPGGKTYKLTVEGGRVVAFEFVSEKE